MTDYTISHLAIGRSGKGDRLPALMISPVGDRLRFVTVLIHPEGKATYLDSEGKPAAAKPFDGYFTTNNRTGLQERVQDLITTCAFAQSHSKGRQVMLVGSGRAGLWPLLAAPAADAVVADCAALDLSDDRALMEPDILKPGWWRVRAFAGIALAAPNPLTDRNTGKNLPTDILHEAYASPKAKSAFQEWNDRMSDEEIANGITELSSGRRAGL